MCFQHTTKLVRLPFQENITREEISGQITARWGTMTNEWDRDRAWPGNSLSHLVYVVQRCAIYIWLITRQDLCFNAYIAVCKACPQLVLHQSLNTAYNTSLFCFPAPSTVSIMHQVSRTIDSITLSWSQPDQPNGVILDYELQYYEKVPHKHTWVMCALLVH